MIGFSKLLRRATRFGAFRWQVIEIRPTESRSAKFWAAKTPMAKPAAPAWATWAGTRAAPRTIVPHRHPILSDTPKDSVCSRLLLVVEGIIKRRQRFGCSVQMFGTRCDAGLLAFQSVQQRRRRGIRFPRFWPRLDTLLHVVAQCFDKIFPQRRLRFGDSKTCL